MKRAHPKIVGLMICISTLAAMLLGGAHLAAAPSPAVIEAESHRVAAIDKVKNCVLAVFPATGQGGGSGVVITRDGYALSNFHVVHPCGNAMQCGMADGKLYDAVLVSIDPTGDVALIKLFGRDDFPCAKLGDSDSACVGDSVFAIGNPFLLATDLQPSVTYGIVSGVHRYQSPAGTLLEYADCLQIGASINPGNSGGPLFDSQGRLIGINGRASFEKRGRVNVGVAYAISINQIANFLGALHSGRIVDHATLGARVGSDSEGRVVVTDILDDSDAYRRGLRYDDEIISFGGRTVTTPNGFKNALGIFPSGWRVPLSYRRDGQRHDTLVRLVGVHGEEELLEKAAARPPVEPEPRPTPDSPPKSGPPEDKNGDHEPPWPPRRIAEPLSPNPEPLMPEIVRQHYQKKRGYSNYYFNTLNQRRVWDAWNARMNLQGAKSVWAVSGRRLSERPSVPFVSGSGSEDGSDFRFDIADGSVSLKLPAAESNWSAAGDIGSSLLPAHSGGLLPALYLWRRLAVLGLDRFGEVHYYGTAPLVGHEGLVDVLVGSHKGAQCRFYFDPVTGDLLALEMFAGENSDPCEVYFSDYREAAGHYWPGRMDVRHGNEVFAMFGMTKIRSEK
jgi:serine protease Do